MNNLILVRHGQSEFNLERRFTGFYDVGLTSKGESEAKHAGETIKKLNIGIELFRIIPAINRKHKFCSFFNYTFNINSLIMRFYYMLYNS